MLRRHRPDVRSATFSLALGIRPRVPGALNTGSNSVRGSSVRSPEDDISQTGPTGPYPQSQPKGTPSKGSRRLDVVRCARPADRPHLRVHAPLVLAQPGQRVE